MSFLFQGLLPRFTLRKKRKMIRLIVFDMAGTVINEDNVVYKTLQKAANQGGIDVDLAGVLAEGAGKEKFIALHDIAARYAPSTGKESLDKMYSEFLRMLDKAYEHLNVTPMPGAKELFSELKRRNILVALNTGYNKKTSDQLLAKLGWNKSIDVDEIVTASEVANTRPHPDMILYAMKSLGIQDARTVMKIGDSQIDIEEGKNAGCGITVGITTGAHTREQLLLARPDYVIDHLSEVLNIL
jgi:phosphonatase-like hydrolase